MCHSNVKCHFLIVNLVFVFLLSQFFKKLINFVFLQLETKLNFYINFIHIFLLNLIFLYKLIFLLYIFNKTSLFKFVFHI